MGTPSGPLLRVQLIGRLRITIGGRILDAAGFGGTRPRQLLEILLLNRGTTLSRNEIIGLLWGPDPPGNPTATLQAYISILRDRLQPGQRASGPLRTTGEGYRIEPGLIDLDLDRFEALTRAAVRAAPERAYILLCRALALVAGPLLADEPDPDWAETARARHTLRVTETRLLAANTALRTGRTEEAISWARQVLETDPLSEPAWSALIRALEAAGRHADGLQAYNRYRHLLQQELGCAPGPGLRAVRNRLLAPALDADAELSETVAALITLHEHHHPAETPTAAGPADPAALAAAAEALTRFMHKALTDQEKPPRPGET